MKNNNTTNGLYPTPHIVDVMCKPGFIYLGQHLLPETFTTTEQNAVVAHFIWICQQAGDWYGIEKKTFFDHIKAGLDKKIISSTAKACTPEEMILAIHELLSNGHLIIERVSAKNGDEKDVLFLQPNTILHVIQQQEGAQKTQK